MITTQAAVVKKIWFINQNAKQRYLDGLRIGGKSFYILDEYSQKDGTGTWKEVIKIVENYKEIPLMRDIEIRNKTASFEHKGVQEGR